MKPKNQDFLIRKATMKDTQDIWSLSSQLGYPDTMDKIEIRLKNILHTAGHEIFVADTNDGRVSGFIHIYFHTSLVIDPLVEIGSLVVDQDYQRMGIGKALLTAAEEWAKKACCRQIRLHSNIIRIEAHKFYQAQGYTNIKTQHAFLKKLD